jgi:hypothetical protein
VPEIQISWNYFAKEKPMDRAGPVHHGLVAMADLGSSPELGLRPLRGSRSPGKGRRTGNPLRASSEDGRWRGGQATEGNGGGGRCSVRWGLRTRERAKKGGGECGDGRGCSSPFYRG